MCKDGILGIYISFLEACYRPGLSISWELLFFKLSLPFATPIKIGKTQDKRETNSRFQIHRSG